MTDPHQAREEPGRFHELKTWPDYYVHLLDGTKTFEYRRNDRDFRVGDVLYLREWEPLAWDGAAPTLGRYTGRSMCRRVTYMLNTSQEFVIMALESATPPNAEPAPSAICTCRESDYGAVVIFGCPIHDEPLNAGATTPDEGKAVDAQNSSSSSSSLPGSIRERLLAEVSRVERAEVAAFDAGTPLIMSLAPLLQVAREAAIALSPQPVTTDTALLWASMNDDQRYEEYIRVRTLKGEGEAAALDASLITTEKNVNVSRYARSVKRERDLFLEALVKFGGHDVNCLIDGTKECTCGFSALLAGAGITVEYAEPVKPPATDTLERSWERFNEEERHAQVEVGPARKAFYAGAQAFVGIVSAAMEDELDAEAWQRLECAYEELAQACEEMKI